MNIRSINPTNNFKTLKTINPIKKESQLDEEKPAMSHIAFYGVTTQINPSNYRRVVIKNEQTKAITDKFLSIIRNLPEGSKISSPRFFSINNKNYAYTVDKKTEPSKIKFVLKSNVENLEEWNNKNNVGTLLDCLFDRRGLMQVAKLENISGTMKKSGATYHHTGKEGRRIDINDKLYRPKVGNKDFWSFVPNPNARYSMGEFDLLKELKDIEFADIFLEFAKNKTSVLLK